MQVCLVAVQYVLRIVFRLGPIVRNQVAKLEVLAFYFSSCIEEI